MSEARTKRNPRGATAIHADRAKDDGTIGGVHPAFKRTGEARRRAREARGVRV